jgi:hypothetical protein
MYLGVMHGARRYRIRIAGFRMEVRFAADQKLSFAFQHVAGLDAGVVWRPAATRSNLGDPADGGAAG